MIIIKIMQLQDNRMEFYDLFSTLRSSSRERANAGLCQSRLQSEFVALPLLWDTRGRPAI